MAERKGLEPVPIRHMRDTMIASQIEIIEHIMKFRNKSTWSAATKVPQLAIILLEQQPEVISRERGEAIFSLIRQITEGKIETEEGLKIALTLNN